MLRLLLLPLALAELVELAEPALRGAQTRPAPAAAPAESSEASEASAHAARAARLRQCGVLGGPQRKGRRARIVHGVDTERCAYRWQVSIQTQEAQSAWHFCGGTLLSPDWVLTAAHCASEVTNVCQLRKLRVVAGDWKQSSSEDKVMRRVKKVFSIPSYDVAAKSDNDFALLQLDKPVPINECIGTACLPHESDPIGQECSITGWGTVSNIGPTPDTLQEAMVKLLDNKACKEAYAKSNDTVTDAMICASGVSDLGITDSCQGDSGGPLSCEENGRWVVRGVTSWGEGCAMQGFPGVYARVSSAVGWIRDVMAGRVTQSDFDTDESVDFRGKLATNRINRSGSLNRSQGQAISLRSFQGGAISSMTFEGEHVDRAQRGLCRGFSQWLHHQPGLPQELHHSGLLQNRSNHLSLC
ncbi:unnamed protein product [Effrenium voratum]|nr:unnamed protein product [Effrenium voratum]